jgi:hypothetical protein
VDAVTALLATCIPPQHLHVNEQHGGYVRYSVPAQHMDLALCFSLFERHKTRLGVLDYSVSQASLEQIFIQFASAQEEERGSRGRNGLREVRTAKEARETETAV